MSQDNNEVTYEDVYGKEEHVAESVGELLAFVKGTLSASEHQRVETHLHVCAACRLEVLHLERAVEAMRDASGQQVPHLNIGRIIFWERRRAALRKFLQTRLPREVMRRFDDVWQALNDENVLGAFRIDGPTLEYARGVAEDRLPILIGALSNVAGKSGSKAGSVELLKKHGRYSSSQAQTLVDEFTEFLKQEDAQPHTEPE